MEDHEIVALYWAREETAIAETQDKYSRYLTKIAYNILADVQDSGECVNDTYFRAWNSIPPHRPCVLSTYLGKITRQLSIDRLRRQHSKKREGSQYELSWEELSDCIADHTVQPEQEVEAEQLAAAINTFLYTLPQQTRNLFVCRYYFMDSIRDIAGYTGFGESKIKSILYRTRLRLRDYLDKEGLL